MKRLLCVLSALVLFAACPSLLGASAASAGERAAVQYSVYHYVESHTHPEITLYMTETLTGLPGETTAAKALELIGYDVQSFSQTKITADGAARVNIVYKKGTFKKGDVDCGGETDMLDIVVLQRRLAEWEGYDDSAVCIYTSDCNNDGNIDNLDALMLCRELAGIRCFPEEPEKPEEPWGPWI